MSYLPHQAKYDRTPAGRARKLRYKHSPKGIACKRRYNRGPAAKAAAKRYRNKPEVFEHKRWMIRSWRRKRRLQERAL